MEPIRELFVQRKQLEKEIRSLKSSKSIPSSAPPSSIDTNKLTVEKMRQRRAAWMRSRVDQIAAELAEDDGELLENRPSKQKESKWKMLKHVLDLDERGEEGGSKASRKEKELNIPLPPDVSADDVIAVKVGGASIEEDEEFLRSDMILPPPMPTSVETVVLKKLANQEVSCRESRIGEQKIHVKSPPTP